jgi:hypothetical protein
MQYPDRVDLKSIFYDLQPVVAKGAASLGFRAVPIGTGEAAV